MYAKHLLTCFLGLAVSLVCQYSLGQSRNTLTIDSCYLLARQNYPLIQQLSLIEQSKDFSLENASKGFLPRINLSGQASYQSDVIQIPLDLPGIDVPMGSRDQYKIYVELVQPISDLFTIDLERNLLDAKAEVAEQQMEVEIYNLKERINQLFFGILLIDAQRERLKYLTADIRKGIDKINGALANGAAIKSSVDILHAELLKAKQQGIELEASRAGYMDMLALYIDQDIGKETILEKPTVHSLVSSINRPELLLFDRQKKILVIQNSLVAAKVIPRFSLFFQGGYGKPAINLLNNNFDLFYFSGIRLNWNISDFYTQKNEKLLLNLERSGLDVQRETFLFNTQISLNQQDQEINKLLVLIQTDEEIIKLRESITNSSKAQLENGIITIDDYLHYLNEENRAKQDLLLHQIQLLLEQYRYKHDTGN